MVEVGIESDRYSDETRQFEDQFKEAIYVDLDGRSLDYSSLSSNKIAEISSDLRTKHGGAIQSFEAAFMQDEIRAGSTPSYAQAQADAYVADYFQSLWDVPIDLNN